MALMPEEAAWTDYFRGFLHAGGQSCSDERVMMLAQIFRRSPTGIIVVDAEGRLLFANGVASEMLEYDRELEPETTWEVLRTRRAMRGADGGELTEEHDPMYIALRKRLNITTNITFATPGTEIEDWLSVTAFPVFADFERAELIGAVMEMTDITDYKGMQEMLYHQATHDQLTGLANRATLSAAMKKAIARSKRTGARGALLFLDVDKFKRVNDSLGHSSGDALLTKIAQRLTGEIRDTDVVARVGGDEFAVLIADVNVAEIRKVAGDIARRICRSISKPYMVQGEEAYATMSIGISIFPDNGIEEEELLAKADRAMYRVKESGRNGWMFYGDDDGNIERDVQPGAEEDE